MNKLVEVVIVSLISLLITATTYVVGFNLGWVSQLDKIEFAGVFLNYACVILTVRQNIWAWPIGILAVIVLGVLFWNYSLYSSLALSILYFLPVQFLGWWAWLKGNQGKELSVSTLTQDQYLMIVFSALPVYFAIVALNNLAGGASPFLDTIILVASVLAQYLLTWKKLESWVLWILVNVVSVYVYGTSGAMLLAFQYTLFLGNAVYGFGVWKKELKNV